jgi:hypothetical protein
MKAGDKMRIQAITKMTFINTKLMLNEHHHNPNAVYLS